MSRKEVKAKFQENPDFCGECGTILPHPDVNKDYIECALCKYRWPAKAVINKVVWSYEEKFVRSSVESEATSGSADGPQVDRTCAKCGHNKMAYTTRQTRSADEGMTVFFTCVKCGHKDIEYS